MRRFQTRIAINLCALIRVIRERRKAYSRNYPATPGAFQTALAGRFNAFITKLNPDGARLAYSTYLGRSNVDAAFAVALDAAGDAYITGSAGANFPITNGAFQRTLLNPNGNAFVAKLNPTGSALIYATYIGDIGFGKSTILRYIYDQLSKSPDVKLASIITPNFLSEFAFLKSICGEFGIKPYRSMLAQESALREFLIENDADGKTAVILIDEAQKLPGKQLELVRVLLNFETSKYKLIQIIMAGQMELKYKLLDSSKRAIASRVFAPSNLSPLSPEETRAMVAFRCNQSGVENPFPSDTVDAIYNMTSGVPRQVLKICQVLWTTAQRAKVGEIPVEWVEPALSEAVLNA